MLKNKLLEDLVNYSVQRNVNYQEIFDDETDTKYDLDKIFDGVLDEFHAHPKNFMNLLTDHRGNTFYVTMARINGDHIPIRLYIGGSKVITLVYADKFISFDSVSKCLVVYAATKEMTATFSDYRRIYLMDENNVTYQQAV